MFSNTILTSWAGCPQSRLYHEVVAHGDREAARQLTLVARQWDHTMAPRWLLRLVPARLQPGPFDAAAYARVLRRISIPALESTLDHVAWLRTQPYVRGSLRTAAFLEHFEAAVARELDRRTAPMLPSTLVAAPQPARAQSPQPVPDPVPVSA